jgi:hypothetical protein
VRDSHKVAYAGARPLRARPYLSPRARLSWHLYPPERKGSEVSPSNLATRFEPRLSHFGICVLALLLFAAPLTGCARDCLDGGSRPCAPLLTGPNVRDEDRVPDVVGLRLEEAKTKLGGAGFRVSVVLADRDSDHLSGPWWHRTHLLALRPTQNGYRSRSLDRRPKGAGLRTAISSVVPGVTCAQAVSLWLA